MKKEKKMVGEALTLSWKPIGQPSTQWQYWHIVWIPLCASFIFAVLLFHNLINNWLREQQTMWPFSRFRFLYENSFSFCYLSFYFHTRPLYRFLFIIIDYNIKLQSQNERNPFVIDFSERKWFPVDIHYSQNFIFLMFFCVLHSLLIGLKDDLGCPSY